MTQPNTQAPADEREEFEAWCIGNGYSIRFVPGGLGVDGQPVYDDPRTHAAWWAWQDRAALASQPAQAETVVPEFNGWYCAQCQCGVDGRDVTYHEQHTACGRVITNDRPPAPPQAQPAPVAPVPAEPERLFSPMWFAPLDGTRVLLHLPTTNDGFAVCRWTDGHGTGWLDDEDRFIGHEPHSFMSLNHLGKYTLLGKAHETDTDEPSRFTNVRCSQCGLSFGPGNAGFSHCDQHIQQPAPVAVDERPDCFEFAMDFLGGLDAEKVRAYVETLEARVALPSARSGQAASAEDMAVYQGIADRYHRDVSGQDGGDAGGARMPGLTSGVVNDVCWKFVEALPRQLPGPIWNDLKPAMYEALKLFHAQVAAPAATVQAGQRVGEGKLAVYERLMPIISNCIKHQQINSASELIAQLDKDLAALAASKEGQSHE